MDAPTIPCPGRRLLDASQHRAGVTSYPHPHSHSCNDPFTRAPFKAAADVRTAVRTRTWALGLIACYGLFHLLYSSFIGLAGDEAYYWQWSRQLDWGYYDHPPMIAYLIALGESISGHGELGVRLMSVLLSSATLWLVYHLAGKFTALSPPPGSAANPDPSSAGLWAVISLMAAPMFGMGGFLATPDIPMVFFWTLSIALTWRAVQDPAAGNWVLVGLAIGFGLLSKYSMVILPVALLAALAATHHGRRLLRTRGPWIAAGAAFLVSAPHLLWLLRHDFVSVQFQLNHGLGAAMDNDPHSHGSNTFVHFVVGQLGVMTPPLFMLFLWAIGLASVALIVWRGRRNTLGAAAEILPWLVVLPAMLTLLVFASASFYAKSQPNWPVAAYTTISAVLGYFLAVWIAGRSRMRILAGAAVAPAMLITGYAHFEAAFPTLPYGKSVFDKLQEKRSLANWLDALRKQSARKQSAPVLADNYRLASLLAFYLADRPRTDAPYEIGSGAQYVLWHGSGDSAPQGMVWYLTHLKNDMRMTSLFQDYRLEGVYVEERAGTVTGRTYAYFGHLIRKPATQVTMHAG